MRAFSVKSAALALAVLAGSASMVHAQDWQPEVVAEETTISVYGLTDALLAEGEAEAACALIEQVYGPDTDDLGALTRLANCNLAQGRPGESVALLERAQTLYPDQAELVEQTEMARIALTLAELVTAVAEVERLEAEASGAARPPAPLPRVPLPEPEPEQIAETEPELPGPQTFGRVSLQRVFNSNVNGGTYNDSFVGLGLPLVVAPESQEQAGWATRVSVDGSVLIPLDWINAVQINAGAAGTLQDVHSAHSRLDLMLSAGWITGTNVTGGQVRPHVELNWVGGLYEGLSLGVEGSAHHQISDSTVLTGSLDVAHRFQTNAADAGWATTGRVGVRHTISPQLQAGANLVAERVAVGSAARSYWRMGPEVYVNAALTEELGLNINAGLDFVGFDGSIALFAGQRADMRLRAGVSLNWSLAHIAEGLSMQSSYSFSHQQSNQDLYDTNRHLATVSLSYAF